MTVWELIALLEKHCYRKDSVNMTAWEIVSTLERIKSTYEQDSIEGAALDAAIGLVSGLLAVEDDMR